MEPFEKRGDFEHAISLAFDGAEIAPDPHLWDKIDAGIAKDQSSSYKKRLFIFQLVAAASLVFAATITLFQVFNNEATLSESDQLLGKESTEATDKSISEKPSNELAQTPIISEIEEDQKTEEEVDGERKETDESNVAPLIAEEENLDIADEQFLTIVDQNEIENNKDVEPAVVEESETAFNLIITEITIENRDYDIAMNNKPLDLKFFPVWIKKKESKKTSDMWASAGLTSGNYNPSQGGGFGFGFAAADEAFAPQLDQGQSGIPIYSDEQTGRSIGGGIGLGARISRKWTLESGLNYLHSEIDGTTNSIVESSGRVYPVYYETDFAGSVRNTSDFGVTSSFDFITVPIKAGYVLIDKKIGWVATGGFGSSILVNNSLDSQLGQFDRIRYSVSDSPYRRLSLSGIIGTEVYFNIAEDYQLMFVPQYNFGITPITKQESSFSIVPNSFNLGLRFRYLLK